MNLNYKKQFWQIIAEELNVKTVITRYHWGKIIYTLKTDSIKIVRWK